MPNICLAILNIIYSKEIQIHSRRRAFICHRQTRPHLGELILLDFKAPCSTNFAIAHVQEALAFHPPTKC